MAKKKKPQKKKNFSWGWMFFWLLLTGVGGFVYLLVKLLQKD
jgi:hypothetical protein